MLDLRFIRDNVDLVKTNCAERKASADVDALVALAERKQSLATELQDVQRRQNDVAKKNKGPLDAAVRQELIAEGKALKDEAAALEATSREVDEQVLVEQQRIPNLTHPDAPRDGVDRMLREVGVKPTFSFKPVDHLVLCDRHKLANFEAAAKVTGADFYYLTGDGALLELALVNYAVRLLVGKGFTPILTPDLAREKIMNGAGYIPRGPETQIYSIADTDLCLIATAEITLAGMYADETIPTERLPLKYVGMSHCFRTESGAAGRATRGLFRVHQFTKVEMFVFCTPEDSEKTHQELLAIEEEFFQGLEIPYRVLDIAASDLGGPAYRKYDVEAWMPGRGEAGEYAEVTSTSNCTDYQARRLNIRTKAAAQKGTTHLHMLNGTATAIGRTIIALLENHQQEDGTVRIPAKLAPYFGKDKIG
ncbi:MAG: serine--tRNA ligase [Planctomycetia bacterium]